MGAAPVVESVGSQLSGVVAFVGVALMAGYVVLLVALVWSFFAMARNVRAIRDEVEDLRQLVESQVRHQRPPR